MSVVQVGDEFFDGKLIVVEVDIEGRVKAYSIQLGEIGDPLTVSIDVPMTIEQLIALLQLLGLLPSS